MNRFVHNPNAPLVPNRREQFYGRNFNQQFEDPRRFRTYRPPIAEQGRWVTLGSPNLKPIHQKIYKYGYNPNVHKMTKTQRRKWIRNHVMPQILISVCVLSPTSGIYWVELGFINNCKEPQL